MNLNKIRTMFEEQKLNVNEYRLKMFKKYEELLEYRELIGSSHVSKIAITEKEVIFTIKNKNVENIPYEIDMVIYKEDAAAVPAAMLSTTEGYEPEELMMANTLCGYIEGSGVFLDIGANLGWYTLNICKQYPMLTGYAFEPIRETYLKMERNVELNGLKNCRLYQMGLSNENKMISFFYDVKASGASSMVDLREMASTIKVDCEVRCLDDFIESEIAGRIDFIKCDVEGAELLVYEGGIKSLEKYKPMVFSEMLRKWSAKFHYHPNDIIRLFERLGYQCFVLAGNNRLRRFGYVEESTVETNYFFLCPQAHKKAMKELCLAE